MIKEFIDASPGVIYIQVDDYINFFEQIPLKLWSKSPVFYFKNDKYDGLGLLGERIHEFTLKSKTLELYFKDCLEIKLTSILDNNEISFKHIENPKQRLLHALRVLKKEVKERDLKITYQKAKNILNGRYY
tara:strand:+ start:621 stop:1013 length:393 start_codon:yes stop_codon:yes gene_type:complete